MCPAILETVDFVLPDGMCVFRTCEEERERVVFQMVRHTAASPNDPALSLPLCRRELLIHKEH